MARQFKSTDTSVWGDRYGSGSAGALTISGSGSDAAANTTITGTSSSTSATAGSGTGFEAGDLLLILQTQGTGAGAWELNKISSVGGGTNWTLTYALQNTYSAGAQVYLLEQYSSVTINNGVTLTSRAWNGSTGGIVAFIANGTITVNGTISLTGKGFRGGNKDTVSGYRGESSLGVGTQGRSANGSGGGGSTVPGPGAGGGHALAGADAEHINNYGTGGSAIGVADLTTVFLGSGGGGASENPITNCIAGSTGGGFILFIAKTIDVSNGSILLRSDDTGSLGAGNGSGGGTGSGGSALLKGQVIALGTNKIVATAGTPGDCNADGGTGSVGRIHVDYSKTLTGTTNPTLDSTQDVTLADTGNFMAFL